MKCCSRTSWYSITPDNITKPMQRRETCTTAVPHVFVYIIHIKYIYHLSSRPAQKLQHAPYIIIAFGGVDEKRTSKTPRGGAWDSNAHIDITILR